MASDCCVVMAGLGAVRKESAFSPLGSYSGPDQLIPGRQSTVFPQNKAHGLYHASELVGLLKKKMFNFSLTPTLRCLFKSVCLLFTSFISAL